MIKKSKNQIAGLFILNERENKNCPISDIESDDFGTKLDERVKKFLSSLGA